VERDAVQQQMVEQGWKVIIDEGFIGLIGPFYQKDSDIGPHFAFPTDKRHHNLRGVLQGGAMMTFADRIMGVTARAHTGAFRSATVQLNVQFIDAVQIGETVEAHPLVLRATRQLVFMETKLKVGTRIVASANGIWKMLAPQPG